MPRLLFTKTGEAVWMSHLDLMRLFQRAFKRACLPLTHTQGYNPRPSVSIALPLSVGVESVCELLDFDLTGECPELNEITTSLNAALVPGVKVLQTYESDRKIKDLALLNSVITLVYDAGVPKGAAEEIEKLFFQEMLIIEKKGKNGPTQQDLIPMIHKLEINILDANRLQLQVLACCQNPSLNPMQLHAAIVHYLPELAPDFAKICRQEVYDANEMIFR